VQGLAVDIHACAEDILIFSGDLALFEKMQTRHGFLLFG
jgi:hypothetical protein